ncbi:MAG: IS110 family transposase, partial [Gemmatimonadales bacterium]
MAARKQKRMSAQVVEDEDYQLRFDRVAGIDVAKDSVAVCLRLPPAAGKKRRASRTWEVPATVPDMGALAAELKARGAEKVWMESASDYWRICFTVLEDAGPDVQMVDSRQARNLPGRPKTDRDDAQWIARLTEMGLLRPSFVPPPEIRALRVYTRQLVNLTQDRTRHWQRLEKLLEDALCKLSPAVSKMAGVASVRAMLEAMAGGETGPGVLADLAMGPMRGKRAELVKAFTGMRSGPQHAFALRQHLRAIDFLTGEIECLRARALGHAAQITAAWGVDADGTTGPGAGLGEDAAVLPAVARLTEIPGVSED